MNLHKAFAAAIRFAGAGEELKPFIPIGFILGGEEFLRPAGDQHLLQFYCRLATAFNLGGEVDGEQDDSVDIVGLGFGGDETAVDEKAAGTSVPRQNEPAAEPQNQ